VEINSPLTINKVTNKVAATATMEIKSLLTTTEVTNTVAATTTMQIKSLSPTHNNNKLQMWKVKVAATKVKEQVNVTTAKVEEKVKAQVDKVMEIKAPQTPNKRNTIVEIQFP
jgi:hypothetical protein